MVLPEMVALITSPLTQLVFAPVTCVKLANGPFHFTICMYLLVVETEQLISYPVIEFAEIVVRSLNSTSSKIEDALEAEVTKTVACAL